MRMDRDRVQRITDQHFADEAEAIRRGDGMIELTPGSLDRLRDKVFGKPKPGRNLAVMEKWLAEREEREDE